MIPTLFASADASSIESEKGWGVSMQGQKGRMRCSRTRGDDDGLPDGNVPQCAPHVSLHLGIYPSGELVNEHDGGIA